MSVSVSVSVSVSEREAAAAASKFMSMVTDDLLLEILVRLPHGRNIVQCRTVCKRWHWLLSDFSLLIWPYNQFRNRLQSSNSDYPFTILFTLVVVTDIRLYELFSEESKIIHGAASTNYLNFFPGPVAIKASFLDLLLVSTPSQKYCICNPLTKQCVFLPKAPKGVREIPGLLVYSPPNSNSQFTFSYKVLQIFNMLQNENEHVLDAAIFDSETGEWSQSTLSCPRTLAPKFRHWDFNFVASNGILYCQLYAELDDLRGFAAFDLSSCTSSSRTDDNPIRIWFVHLPINFAPGWQASLEHVCFGDVRGRLRLSQLLKNKSEEEWEFVLKVWELKYNNKNNNNRDQEWLLVHEGRLRRNKTNYMFVAAFHPNNGDVIFMFCDNDLFEYKIREGKYQKVGQLRDPKYLEKFTSKLTRHFCKFTLVHPWWPTYIPTHPTVKSRDLRERNS